MPSLLIATFTYPPEANGVAQVAGQQARGLRDRGWDVTVATSPLAGGPHELDGIAIRRFDCTGTGRMGDPFRGAVDDFLAEAACHDVVLCHSLQSWPSHLAADYRSRIPGRVVLFSHGVSVNLRPAGLKGWLRWLSFRPLVARLPGTLRAFDDRIFLAHRQDHDRFLDFSITRQLQLSAEVIPNGADHDLSQGDATAFRTAHGLGDRPVVLYVANYSALKDQARAIRVFETAIEDRSATLVLVGNAHNAYSEALQETVSRQNRLDVRWVTGLTRSEIADAYATADIFLMTSVTEVQPLVLLDAMAVGMPWVGTAVGGVPALPGGIATQTDEELAAALRGYLIDPTRRSTDGAKGRDAVAQTYNWGAHADRLDARLRAGLLGPLKPFPTPRERG